MIDQTKKRLKAMRAAGVLEPTSKAKKLRSWLPEIESAVASGASIPVVMTFLETAGLVYSSVGVFYSALAKARKSGPLHRSADLPAPSVDPASGLPGPFLTNPGQIPEALPSPTAPQAPPQRDSEKATSSVSSDEHGTTFIRSKRKDQLTNNSPSMEDFL